MDIILLQEALTTDDNLAFFSVNRMGGNFARSFLYHNESAYATGVITLSKSKPISIEYLKTDFKEPLSRTPKITLITKYPFKKKQTILLVVNTHGINFVRSALFNGNRHLILMRNLPVIALATTDLSDYCALMSGLMGYKIGRKELYQAGERIFNLER